MSRKSEIAKKADTLWLSFLKAQRSVLAEVDVHDNDQFKTAIRMALRTGTSQAHLALILGQSRPTISRWQSDDDLSPRILTKESAIVRLKAFMDKLIAEAAAN